MDNIEKIESDLWEAADQLRANSKLTTTEYCIPLLGIFFLRHAANRFDDAARQIEEDQKAGTMAKRPAVKEDYLKRRALYLPEKARYDYILGLPKDTDLGQALIETIYKKLGERRDTSDVTDVLKEIHRIVNQAICANETGVDQAEGLTVDLSLIDFEKLREEFATKVRRKKTALEDIRTIVEKKGSSRINVIFG